MKKNIFKLGLLSLLVITMVSCNCGDKKRKLGLKNPESYENMGVLVNDVVRNSISDRLGLQTGDVIYEVNNTRVYNLAGLKEQVTTLKGGELFVVKFVRDEERVRRKLILPLSKSEKKHSCNKGKHDDKEQDESKLKLVKILKQEDK